MADGTCDWGDDPHGRNWILTRLNPPSTIELCDDHAAPGLVPLLAAELGVDPTGLYQTIERYLARQAKEADKQLAAAAAAAAEHAESSSDPIPGSIAAAVEP